MKGKSDKYTHDDHKYDDIIHLPHHVSRKHPQMSMIDRAAQFSPFAALTGYDAAIQETGRLTDTYVELDESTKAVLDERIQILKSRLAEQPSVTITYFQPDEKKDGGAYASISGQVKKIYEYERKLVLTNGREISFDRISALEGDIF